MKDGVEADLGYAHVDLHRKERCGFPEVIFCEGKTKEWVEGVVRQLVEAGQHCLATRLNAEQASYLANAFPEAEVDRVGRTFWLPSGPLPKTQGRVVVITAGTSDLPVAQEALVTAKALGCEVTILVDVGVAGIHRLLRRHEDFVSADAIVVVAERQVDRAQGEQVVISWEIQEMNPDLNTLKLEYKTSDGFWYPTTIMPAMVGEGKFRPLNNGPVTVRMKVSDLAGNQSAAAEMEIAGHEDIASNLTTTSMQVPGGVQNTPATPVPTFPVATPPQPASPPYTAPASPNNVLPSNPGVNNPAPVIPSSYGGTAPAVSNGNTGSRVNAYQTGPAYVNAAPRVTINSALEKAPPSLVMGPGGGGNAPSTWPQNPTQQAAQTGQQPDVQNHGVNWSPPPPAATGGLGGVGLPPGNPPGYVAERWINNTQTQITNSAQITLNYRIDRVGPSGVGAVDLYLTKDEGRTWQRYAEDPDLKPPMVVDLPGEGVFGLRLVVTSRAGLGRRPPQPGDLPDMRVEVDLTAPVVKLYRPEPDPRRRDAIVLTWEASDHELAAKPITLQWAEQPDGVWNTIATDLTNSQRYVWTVPPNLVRVYLRVVARDMAGNQGFDETADPILVDLHEPEAKILSISSGVQRP